MIKALKTVWPISSFKGLTQAYLVKTSFTNNKYLTFRLLEENDPISAKSAAQIVFESPVDSFSWILQLMDYITLQIVLQFTLPPDPGFFFFFFVKNLQTILANALWYPSYLGFLAKSQALSFKTLPEIVLLAKSLLSEYAA